MNISDEIKREIIDCIKKTNYIPQYIVSALKNELFENGAERYLFFKKVSLGDNRVVRVAYVGETRGYYNFIVNGHLLLEYMCSNYDVIENQFFVAFSVDQQRNTINEVFDKNLNRLGIFQTAEIYNDGFLIVGNFRHGYNMFDKNGELIFDEWYTLIEKCTYPYFIIQKTIEDGYRISNLFNYSTRKFVFEKWFSCLEFFTTINGVEWYQCQNYNSGKWNLVNLDGKYISRYWFDHTPIDYFNNDEHFLIQVKNKWNILKSDGTLLLDEWYEDVVPKPGRRTLIFTHSRNPHIEASSVEVYKDGSINYVD